MRLPTRLPARASRSKPAVRPPSAVTASARRTPGRRPGSALAAGLLKTTDVLQLQRTAGNQAVSGLLLREPLTIQRTIDQDARRWAMDWLAARTRVFCVKAKEWQLPKLSAVIDGVLGDPYDAAAPPPTREARAKYTTALAAGLVALGETESGKLSARLADGKPGLKELMQALEAQVASDVADLTLATAETIEAFDAVKSEIPDPFAELSAGGAKFTFTKEMAEHMLLRHHPDYLTGPPMQVQSFFAKGTTIKQIKALLEGTVMTQDAIVREWRKRRAKLKGPALTGAEATTLNLRPFYDGKHWELTLSINSTNPTESRGTVGHFTPTL
jgi:hypothetical protein